MEVKLSVQQIAVCGSPASGAGCCSRAASGYACQAGKNKDQREGWSMFELILFR
jgi:hypothetical protein